MNKVALDLSVSSPFTYDQINYLLEMADENIVKQALASCSGLYQIAYGLVYAAKYLQETPQDKFLKKYNAKLIMGRNGQNRITRRYKRSK